MTPMSIALRLAVLLAAILVAIWISHAIRDGFDMTAMPANELMMQRSIRVATGVFVVLLAIPFVPGAEIGLAMLAAFGADIAPLVYGATVTALMLAYTIGRLLPPRIIARGLRLAHLTRAADLVDETAALPREARLARLTNVGSARMIRLATRYRYVAILVAINVPGNFLIGGGGGISLVAGMSGLFGPVQFLLTVAVAVCPVPLAILLLGA